MKKSSFKQAMAGLSKICFAFTGFYLGAYKEGEGGLGLIRGS